MFRTLLAQRALYTIGTNWPKRTLLPHLRASELSRERAYRQYTYQLPSHADWNLLRGWAGLEPATFSLAHRSTYQTLRERRLRILTVISAPWTYSGSNREPFACKAIALPSWSYRPMDRLGVEALRRPSS